MGRLNKPLQNKHVLQGSAKNRCKKTKQNMHKHVSTTATLQGQTEVHSSYSADSLKVTTFENLFTIFHVTRYDASKNRFSPSTSGYQQDQLGAKNDWKCGCLNLTYTDKVLHLTK